MSLRPRFQKREQNPITKSTKRYTKLQGTKKYYNIGQQREGEDEDWEDDREVLIGGRGNPIYKKQPEVIHSINPRLATYPWANFWVNTNRYRITSFSILAILILFLVFIFWFPFQWIPALPSSLLTRYGAFEYLIWAGVFPINILIGWLSDRTEFYGMGCLLNFLAFLTYSLLWLVILFSFIRCHTGDLPQSCTDNYLIDSIMFVLTSFLVFATMCATFCYLIVVKQTSGTQDPVLYKLTPK